MPITAKVYLSNKMTYASMEDQVQLTFAPDYVDGANAEWAKNTPALNLTMTVRSEIADKFPMGKYTLTFEPDE